MKTTYKKLDIALGQIKKNRFPTSVSLLKRLNKLGALIDLHMADEAVILSGLMKEGNESIGKLNEKKDKKKIDKLIEDYKSKLNDRLAVETDFTSKIKFNDSDVIDPAIYFALTDYIK